MELLLELVDVRQFVFLVVADLHVVSLKFCEFILQLLFGVLSLALHLVKLFDPVNQFLVVAVHLLSTGLLLIHEFSQIFKSRESIVVVLNLFVKNDELNEYLKFKLLSFSLNKLSCQLAVTFQCADFSMVGLDAVCLFET